VNVDFLVLSRETEAIREELDAAVDRVVSSGRYVLGEEVDRFEAAFAQWCGAGDAIGVASGTDAITIALVAAGVGPGDEVVTPANTCVPTVAGIEAAGAVPVLADVDPVSRTLDPASVATVIGPRTRAIVPVHLYGRCADMLALSELADEHGLVLIEDCAQAHGAVQAGRRAGSLGRAAAFSFYPTKNLGALGDAGAVVTSDPELARTARLLRNYGERARFEHVRRGRNSRLDPLQAAVLATKLPYLEAWNDRRQTIARRYDRALAGTTVVPPAEPADGSHAYHLYVVETPARETFRTRLAEAGVATEVHYPLPIHRQPAYRGIERIPLPASERLATSVVSLPLYPQLDDAEVEHVAEAARAAALEQG